MSVSFSELENERMERLFREVLRRLPFSQQYYALQAVCLNAKMVEHPLVNEWCERYAKQVAELTGEVKR